MAIIPIRSWCKTLGVSQAVLGRVAGLTPAVVSDYARGRRNPTLRTIETLGRTLGREPWEILKGPAQEWLPTEEESRIQNVAWFSRLGPSQKIRAVESDREFRRRTAGMTIRKARRGA